MAGETFSGALGGAAQGAAAGASFGAVGAVIGGVIGGVSGLFAGKKRKKAKKLKKQLERLTTFVARKELLQQSQAQYSALNNALPQTGAGTERSSGGFGVLGSIASQRNNAIRMDNYASARKGKIARLETQANRIEGYIGAASSAVQTGVSAFSQFGGGSKTVSNAKLMADPNYISANYVPQRR